MWHYHNVSRQWKVPFGFFSPSSFACQLHMPDPFFQHFEQHLKIEVIIAIKELLSRQTIGKSEILL